MFKLVATQTLTIAILSLVAYLWRGSSLAVSLILGGLSYIIPTLLAVLILKLSQPYPKLAGAAFIGSSGIKTLFAAILLVLCFLLYPEMHSVENFLAFFIGLLAVSHLVFLIFLKVYRYGR